MRSSSIRSMSPRRGPEGSPTIARNPPSFSAAPGGVGAGWSYRRPGRPMGACSGAGESAVPRSVSISGGTMATSTSRSGVNPIATFDAGAARTVAWAKFRDGGSGGGTARGGTPEVSGSSAGASRLTGGEASASPRSPIGREPWGGEGSWGMRNASRPMVESRCRSEEGFEGGFPRLGFMSVHPSRRGDGTAQGHQHFRDADGVLPGQVLGDPVRDQGAAEPSAETFGDRPVRARLISCQRSRHSGSSTSMTSNSRRSRSVRS